MPKYKKEPSILIIKFNEKGKHELNGNQTGYIDLTKYPNIDVPEKLPEGLSITDKRDNSELIRHSIILVDEKNNALEGQDNGKIAQEYINAILTGSFKGRFQTNAIYYQSISPLYNESAYKNNYQENKKNLPSRESHSLNHPNLINNNDIRVC